MVLSRQPEESSRPWIQQNNLHLHSGKSILSFKLVGEGALKSVAITRAWLDKPQIATVTFILCYLDENYLQIKSFDLKRKLMIKKSELRDPSEVKIPLVYAETSFKMLERNTYFYSMFFMLHWLNQSKSYLCTDEMLLLLPEIVWDYSSFRRSLFFPHFHVLKTRMNSNNGRDL